jgi:2-methylcitrate dehydratase PrpD
LHPDQNSKSVAEISNHRLTRRGLLQRAVWLLPATSFLARWAGAAAQEVSPVMAKLSTYMAEARKMELPEKVVQDAKHHILDTVAAMVSGSELPPGKDAIQFARTYGGGQKVATVVASKIVCGPMDAAFSNGELAHSDESDDDYTSGGAHPGCAVVPATLAIGEQFGISGTHFLRAVTLGYDIGMRAYKTLKVGVLTETHNLVGTMGAAAASGCAASLDVQQMRWLLDYATQQAGAGIGTWRDDKEHIEKAFLFGAMGARNGVTAALVVHSGWTGMNDVLSGPQNFVKSYAPKADPAKLIEDLGKRYEVSLTSIKGWTTGGPIQTLLDAIVNLRKKRPFEANDVKHVVVRSATSQAERVNNREMPDINVQYLVAVMLIDKTVTFHAAHDTARMEDPAVLRERAKVELVGDEELERLLPTRVGIVEIEFTDGTRLTERVENARGTPENPMTREEVVAKARGLMTPVLGAAVSGKLIDRLLDIDHVKNVRELRPLLQRSSTTNAARSPGHDLSASHAGL